MKPFFRYLLFQLPGWVIAAAGASALTAWFGLPVKLGAGLVALLVLADFALYPLFRFGYEAGPQMGPESLVGESATVVKEMDPEGFVKLRGERWKARMLDPEERAGGGETVEVIGLRGLTLFVRKRAS